jgi:hypothetical protein
MLGSCKNIMLAGLCLLVLGGCTTSSFCGDGVSDVRLFRTQTEYMVNNGIRNYEDGNYAASMATLQSLVAQKDATKSEKVLAYKYLAFMHCVSSTESRDWRERMCRESFKKAFELKPDFNLTAAEAGHPVWGPIFSSVKNTPKK